MEVTKNHPKYYLGNRDLLIIAVLSGIGGVMSTYVGYLGNLINQVFGVPFGAGQFASGLHVFWFILVAGLVKKPGAASAAGLLKGIIELLTGSTHGVAIVLVSLVQGLLIDLVLFLFRHPSMVSYMLAGGISAASNVFIFQLLYFSGAPITYIIFIGSLAFVSGILLAGSFGWSVLDVVLQARPYRISAREENSIIAPDKGVKTAPSTIKVVSTFLLILLLAGGAVYYFALVFEPPWIAPLIQVEGAVEKTISLPLAHFTSHETTIRAELQGQVKYVPPQEYTGIPVYAILQESVPSSEATKLKVMASDGYMVEFDLIKVLNDNQMLLIREGDSLRLIAGNYEGGRWVRMVNKFIIE